MNEDLVDNSKIANLMLNLRKKCGMSQELLSQKAGISFRSYQRIEAGQISPRIDTVFKILRILKADPGVVLLDLFRSSVEPIITQPAYELNTIEKLQQHSAVPMLAGPDEVPGLKRALINNFDRSLLEIGYWEANLTKAIYHWTPQMHKIFDVNILDGSAWSKGMSKILSHDFAKLKLAMKDLVDRNITLDITVRVDVRAESIEVRMIAKKYQNKNFDLIIFGFAEKLSEHAY